MCYGDVTTQLLRNETIRLEESWQKDILQKQWPINSIKSLLGKIDKTCSIARIRHILSDLSQDFICWFHFSYTHFYIVNTTCNWLEQVCQLNHLYKSKIIVVQDKCLERYALCGNSNQTLFARIVKEKSRKRYDVHFACWAQKSRRQHPVRQN